ncbi:MAG: MFS transporter [bacterium]|nr:MAG: MFS transporter [bacterium]
MTTPRQVINTYLVITALYTLATSMIWGINTLFLMEAGLDIFQVMVVNAAFTVGMVAFEVPTGVVADTLGRKVSFVLCVIVLFFSTLLYVAAARYQWGIWAFAGISFALGLGFTFQTGAVEAWLVDALDHTGFDGTRERVFARGQTAFSASMLVGTVAGGFLGQVNLALPYLVRAMILIPTLFVILLFMRDLGFEPRPLKAGTFGEETRRIFYEGVSYGWRHPVIRFCVIASFVEGLFFIFGWYSWQRYFLDLLARELIWVAGLVSALFSLSSILGNSLVSRAMQAFHAKSPARLLAWGSLVQAAAVAAAGLLGALAPERSRGPVLFACAVVLYLSFGVVLGVVKPIRQGFINRHIASGKRATVLSVDALFLDLGGVLGQTGLGYLSRSVSIAGAWILGGAFLFAGYPLYRTAEKVEDEGKRLTRGDSDPG